MGGRWEKVCLRCITETIGCEKVILGILVGGCRCATSWCDLDLTYDHAVVSLEFHNLVQAIS